MALLLYWNKAHALFTVGPFESYRSIYTAPPKRKSTQMKSWYSVWGTDTYVAYMNFIKELFHLIIFCKRPFTIALPTYNEGANPQCTSPKSHIAFF